jgi:hypothetical protein
VTFCQDETETRTVQSKKNSSNITDVTFC